jgi:hypothetical protein
MVPAVPPPVVSSEPARSAVAHWLTGPPPTGLGVGLGVALGEAVGLDVGLALGLAAAEALGVGVAAGAELW